MFKFLASIFQKKSKVILFDSDMRDAMLSNSKIKEIDEVYNILSEFLNTDISIVFQLLSNTISNNDMSFKTRKSFKLLLEELIIILTFKKLIKWKKRYINRWAGLGYVNSLYKLKLYTEHSSICGSFPYFIVQGTDIEINHSRLRAVISTKTYVEANENYNWI